MKCCVVLCCVVLCCVVLCCVVLCCVVLCCVVLCCVVLCCVVLWCPVLSCDVCGAMLLLLEGGEGRGEGEPSCTLPPGWRGGDPCPSPLTRSLSLAYS